MRRVRTGKAGETSVGRHTAQRRLEAAAGVEIAALEARLLYCVEHLLPTVDPNGNELANSGAIIVMGPTVPSADAPVQGSNPLSSIPALSSHPGAAATLYLDFNGAAAQAWGSYSVPATPAFTQDGDTTTFTDSELAAIQEIWTRVAEAYAPFNINVTTVDPGTYADGQALAVVIGGGGSWLGAAAGGVSYVGSFTNYLQNVTWVFPTNLGNGYAKYVADAAEHEAGHAFGLQHQSAYGGASKTAEYRGGTSLVAPIMGSSYGAARSKWAYGQSSIGYSSYQDDMAVIAANPFGYRADDHGNTVGTADALDVSAQNVSGSGVIEKVGDVDVFSFVTSAGTVNFTVSGPQYGGLLDATLKLVDLNGTVIAQSDTASLGESVTANLAAGSYRLIVSSKGTYGDVGQYTVGGTIVPNENYVAPPSNLTATKGAGGGVSLAWYDNPWNETGFTIERSSDGGATWGTLDTVAANTHGYLDATASVGSSYTYRVRAFNDVDQSTYSNAATVAVTPATPGGLTAASISASRIDLSWADVTGETGYVIERSVNGTTWSTIANLGADTTSYSDSALAAGTRYFYRIRAGSGVGASTTSAAVYAYTRPAQSNLTLTVVSTGQINLSWRDVVGETYYRIERTADGTNWSLVTTRGANVLTYSNVGLTADTIYSYRVTAVNAGGDGLSASATATTLLVAPTGLSVTALSISQINLTWANSTGETGYRVERSTDERTWTILGVVGADVTSYSSTALAGGTRYVYRVRAINAGGVSAPGASAATYTVPLAPTISASAASDTRLNLAWANVAGETGYVLQRSDDGTSGWNTIASPTVNVASYANTGLTADTTYYYRVVAHNASGDSAASNVVAGRTLLPTVTGLTTTGVSTTRIDLTWDESTGETGYRVERFNGKGYTLIGTTGADVHTFSSTGLTPGATYYFHILAINASGASIAATGVGGTTLPLAPTITTVSAASDTQLNVVWTNVAGETNYVLQRSDDGTTGWTTVASPTVNVITSANTGLTADTRYYYRVVAHNASGDSAASNVVAGRTLLPTVTGATATGVSSGQINLSWGDSTGESGYRIERLSGVSWVLVGTTAADVCTFSSAGLSAGTTYSFRVRAVNAGGASLMPTPVSGTTTPLATTLTAVAASTSQVRLSWVNVNGETGYRVERSTDGSTDWTVIASPLANVVTYLDSGLSTDAPYYYRVTAFNASGDAAASVGAVKTIRTLLPAPTGLTATAASSTQVNLAWDDSAGETGYRVERSANGITWGTVASLAAGVTSYADTGLAAGTPYQYRVRAVNAGGASDPATKAVVTTKPAAAAMAGSAYSANQINLGWTNVAGETGYRLETSTNGSTWSLLTTTGVNVTTYAHTGLTADTVYYYRVTAFNASGDAPTSTVFSKRTVLNAPTGLTATATSPSTVNLSWADSAGETGYRVERFIGKAWAAIATTGPGVTTFTNTGLTRGATYYFRVRASNAGGDSAPSGYAMVTMPLSTTVVRSTTVRAASLATAGIFQSKHSIADLLAA